jgi:glycerol-3-phosphate acyltransferase PlsY
MFCSATLLLVMGAYGIGAIPTGYWVAYWGGIKDIRNHGSGNIGATNVARILGIHYFIPVFLLDAAKAAAYLMLLTAYCYNESLILASAVALVIGNSYSFFLHFTGGKGFATTAGIVWTLKPWLALLLFGIWTFMALLTRTVGIASAITCLGLAISGMVCHDYLSLTFIGMGLWGIWRHVDNIKRYCRTILQLPID